jgi:multidrug resistance efflux pump
MEHLIRAPRDGVVASISAAPGALVSGGATLVELVDAAASGDSAASGPKARG